MVELARKLANFVQTRLCLVNLCLKAGTIPVFLCRICRFTLHVGCALPPVGTTKYHRHPLSYASFHVEDDFGKYYCDNCEKRRNPRLPDYRCLEGNCKFVVHFDCVFSENQLLIAHKLDNGRSRVVIINPALTAVESLKSIAEDEVTNLDAIVRAARSRMVDVLEVPQLDDSGCSNNEKDPIYEEFIVFMGKYVSIPGDTISEWNSIKANSQDANGGRMHTISNFFGPLLDSWFRGYINSLVNSTLRPRREEPPFFVASCKAIYSM